MSKQILNPAFPDLYCHFKMYYNRTDNNIKTTVPSGSVADPDDFCPDPAWDPDP